MMAGIIGWNDTFARHSGLVLRAGVVQATGLRCSYDPAQRDPLSPAATHREPVELTMRGEQRSGLRSDCVDCRRFVWGRERNNRSETDTQKIYSIYSDMQVAALPKWDLPCPVGSAGSVHFMCPALQCHTQMLPVFDVKPLPSESTPPLDWAARVREEVHCNQSISHLAWSSRSALRLS